MTRFTHPEQRPNEIFGGNIWPGDFPRIGWRTKRLGKKGFDRDGKPFGRSDSMRSWFVEKAELDAAGVDVPERGPVDHRWGGAGPGQSGENGLP